MNKPGFLEEIAEARDWFDRAARKDLRYRPARLNRIATLILAGKHDDAFIEIYELMEAGFEGEDVVHLEALAAYLVGSDMGAVGEKIVADALDTLRGLHAQAPENDDLTYNLAMIFMQTENTREASTLVEAFLERHPYGPHAEHLRGPSTLEEREPYPKQFPEPPPIALGEVDERTRRILEDMDAERLCEEPAVTLFTSAGFNILVLNNEVVVVRRELESALATSPEQNFGPPVRREVSTNRDVWFYPGFAIEAKTDGATNILYFSNVDWKPTGQK